jgi:hypothetical protein
MTADYHTPTETALEETFGIHPTRHYAWRADQLADGTYRYALEDPETGAVLAEGVHTNDQVAMRKFEDNLANSGLTPEEIRSIRDAADAYEATL